MGLYEVPFPAWTEAFVEAEGEGREVELFAAMCGVEPYVRPEGVCIRCEGAGAVPRYVVRWAAWHELCPACAGAVGAR